MRERLLRPADLGTPYQIADQSTAMFVAGFCLLGFAFFHACADLSESDSIVSALTRIAGSASAFGIVLALHFALPKSMSGLKWLVIVLGAIGTIAQVVGVNHLMQPRAEVVTFYGFHYLAQVFYILCLITFGIVVFKHHFLPNWMAFALLFADIVWSIRYLLVIREPVPPLVNFLSWGPGLIAELIGCAGFFLAAIHMRKHAAQKINKGRSRSSL